MNETTLPLPFGEQQQGHPRTAAASWAPTQPNALNAQLTPAQPRWLKAAPGRLSLRRALVLATGLHVLLVLLVGTQQGAGLGAGGRPGASMAVSEISIRLQDVRPGPALAPAALAAPSLVPSPAPPTVGAARTARPKSATQAAPTRQTQQPQAPSPPPSLPAAERRAKASAPDLGPVPVPQAGLAPQGAVLRGLDSGLPAAPALADLQAPPVPPLDAPPLPAVLAVPAPKAPARSGPIQSSTPLPAPMPSAPASPADAKPKLQPALVEAQRASLPRADEATRGTPDALRKASAAPALASRPEGPPAPAATAASAQAPLAGPPVFDEPPATPARPAVAERPANPVAVAAPPRPPPVPAPVRPPLPEAREAAPAPLVAPAPPAAALPADPPAEPAGPRVLTRQTTVAPPREQALAQPLPVPDLPAAPVVPAPAPPAPARTAAPAAPPSPTPSLPPVVPASLPAGPSAAAGLPSPTPARVPTPGEVLPGSAGPSALPVPAGLDAGLRGIINLPPPPALAASAPSAPFAPSAASGKLNLDLPRAGATPTKPQPNLRQEPLNLTPPPADPRSKLARDLEKAGKADCRTAHSDKGLLAAPALVLDALKKDGGCKW